MSTAATGSRIAQWIAGLLTLGAAVLITSVGAWWLAGIWLAAAALIGWAMWALRTSTRTRRVLLCIALLPVLVLLGWEGGLLFVPALLALMVSHVVSPPRPVPPHDLRTGSGASPDNS